MVRIGSARSNEHGGINDGQPGDQKGGGEVSTQAWYLHSKGWTVIRARDSAVREKIARNMEAACANNKIGYCQDHRSTLTAAAKLCGYDAAKVTTPVETDCSELVRVCCLYAGIRVGSFSTASEAAVLEATGEFDILKADKYCKSADYLMRGDILVTRSKGHTVVALDNGPLAAPAPAVPAGWEKDTQGKYKYRKAGGAHAANEWLIINHHWYLFDAAGYMRTGWARWNPSTCQVDLAGGSGDWYFLDDTVNGPLEGACWHSRPDGAMEIWNVS